MKYKMIIGLCFTFLVLISSVTYASEVIPDFEPQGSTKEITIIAEVPEGFEERIEIYLNGAPRAMSYDQDLEYMGYQMKIPLVPDHYDVSVISTTDFDKRYQFHTIKMFDAKVSDLLTIQVIDTWEEGSSDLHDEHIDMEVEEINIEPSIYDFSAEEPSGTIHIQCKTYAAVESVAFCLVGDEKAYDIVLDRQHMFEAIVTVPIGFYFESSTIQVVLDPDARAIEGMNFLWGHETNPGFWGNYYEILKDDRIQINDLLIQMAYQGEVEEISSNMLFRSTLMENYIHAYENHVSDELESAFPDGIVVEETETIAVALPVPDEIEEPTKGKIPFLLPVCIVILMVAGSLLYFRRKRENRYY